MTQKEMVINHLKVIGAITPLEALTKYGEFRLAARINELRGEGHEITTTIIKKNKKHFAEYSLKEKACN